MLSDIEIVYIYIADSAIRSYLIRCSNSDKINIYRTFRYIILSTVNFFPDNKERYVRNLYRKYEFVLTQNAQLLSFLCYFINFY